MCDLEAKKNQLYLLAVARLKEIFEITSPAFGPALLTVLRKHCRGGVAPTMKKGTRRCRQTYMDLSTRPMYKEVFGGIVKMFHVRDEARFYKDVGDVVVAHCGMPESKIAEIRLEEMGDRDMPDHMKGRVFKIEIDPRFRDVDIPKAIDSYTIKKRKYKIKWLDLDMSDPTVNFLKNFDEMWYYRERLPPPYGGKGKLGQLILGDIDYKVHFAPTKGAHTKKSEIKK